MLVFSLPKQCTYATAPGPSTSTSATWRPCWYFADRQARPRERSVLPVSCPSGQRPRTDDFLQVPSQSRRSTPCCHHSCCRLRTLRAEPLWAYLCQSVSGVFQDEGCAATDRQLAVVHRVVKSRSISCFVMPRKLATKSYRTVGSHIFGVRGRRIASQAKASRLPAPRKELPSVQVSNLP